MNRYLLAAAIVTVMFTSCDSDTTEETYVFKDSTGMTPANQLNSTQQPNVTPVSTSQPNQQPMPITLNSGQIVNPQMPVVTGTQQVATTQTAPGMNPPHGQPNHRCDIAVGAPLNSKPAQVATTSQPQQTVTMTPQPTVPTAPGMNPPHGQPNHRCDIAVGAPLNSKPAVQPVVTQPAVTQPMQATSLNAQQPTQLPLAKKDSGQ